ncbi:uncharacterized protein M421DRAFT_234853 [Didymella exigua CBS 183.55]|uniref:Uncharacterized protein n=1 Tax=Didymella exigua CBS 183.55 TaxID=1150837 RepID=A0A6A5RGP4_9PLEO|nr:uncharacterized protein M421DRAFT_234853 [Didymella exigua CBS 183.55]KAF1925666.1 hypothetical protein M421DRAFT_234853 [Didymella exigua CBS 183.55]
MKSGFARNCSHPGTVPDSHTHVLSSSKFRAECMPHAGFAHILIIGCVVTVPREPGGKAFSNYFSPAVIAATGTRFDTTPVNAPYARGTESTPGPHTRKHPRACIRNRDAESSLVGYCVAARAQGILLKPGYKARIQSLDTKPGYKLGLGIAPCVNAYAL